MQKCLTILTIAFSAAFASSFAPPVELAIDQLAALRLAVYTIIPEQVGIMSIYARREYGMENLVANVESGPYDIQGSSFSAYWLVCEEESKSDWQCRNSDSRKYVFSGSASQRIWLQDGISASIATAILSDVLKYCNVDFDVLIIERPQLWFDRKTGSHKFSAPKCNYEYSFVYGQPILGAPFRMDTEVRE